MAREILKKARKEAGDRTGDFAIWDTLEDITGIHQRKLREIS